MTRRIVAAGAALVAAAGLAGCSGHSSSHASSSASSSTGQVNLHTGQVVTYGASPVSRVAGGASAVRMSDGSTLSVSADVGLSTRSGRTIAFSPISSILTSGIATAVNNAYSQNSKVNVPDGDLVIPTIWSANTSGVSPTKVTPSASPTPMGIEFVDGTTHVRLTDSDTTTAAVVVPASTLNQAHFVIHDGTKTTTVNLLGKATS